MAIIGGLTLATAWLTYFIKSLYKKGMGDQRLIDMESKICGYEVRKRECDAKFTDHGKQNSVIVEKLTAISEKMTYMSEWITKLDDRVYNTVSKRKSPRILTEAGMKLLSVSGGKECIDKNLDFFIRAIDEYNPKLPYDVERMALDVILTSTNRDMFNRIKMFMYKSPEFVKLEGEEVKVNIFSIGYVMSLYLRDLYLEKYPELCEVEYA